MIIVTICMVGFHTFVLGCKSCTSVALMLYRVFLVNDNLYVCKKERERGRERKIYVEYTHNQATVISFGWRHLLYFIIYQFLHNNFAYYVELESRTLRTGMLEKRWER